MVKVFLVGLKGGINCPKSCRPWGHRERKEKQKCNFWWFPGILQSEGMWSLGHKNCSKKNFLEITLRSENESLIFLLIICLSTSIHRWNSVISLILFILPGIRIHVCMGSNRISRYWDFQEIVFKLVKGTCQRAYCQHGVGEACRRVQVVGGEVRSSTWKVTLAYFYPGWMDLTCPTIRGAGRSLPHRTWEHWRHTASPTLLCRPWFTLHGPSFPRSNLCKCLNLQDP